MWSLGTRDDARVGFFAGHVVEDFVRPADSIPYAGGWNSSEVERACLGDVTTTDFDREATRVGSHEGADDVSSSLIDNHFLHPVDDGASWIVHGAAYFV